jgi:hypothetical protein
MSIANGGWPSSKEMQNVKAMRLALKATAKNRRPEAPSDERARKANEENQAASQRVASLYTHCRGEGWGSSDGGWRDYIRADGSIKTGIGDGIFGAVDKMSNKQFR